MKKLLILLLLLSSCNYEDKVVHSKGIIAGFYEAKNTSGVMAKYMSIQDTSGKILTTSIRDKYLLNDSVYIVYHTGLLDDVDKFQLDSCVKFSTPIWKIDKIIKTKFVYVDSGRVVNRVDTTLIFK